MPRSRKEFEEAEKLEEVARNKGNGVSPEPFTDISSYDSVIDSGVLTLRADDLDEVRHIRVRAIHSLSDESLGEYFAYTKMIVGVINRLNLYSEYRSNSK